MSYRRIVLAVLLCLLSLGFVITDGASALLTEVRSQLSAVLVATSDAEEVALQQRGLALRQKLASEDLTALDGWWRRAKVSDPHKYLLPVILARLSLPQRYDPEACWEVWQRLNQDSPTLYHFRSVFDVRLFFQFRSQLPASIAATFQQMVMKEKVKAWAEQGTENHMMMQRISGLALMDGSGFAYDNPAIAATNEAWLRSELTKFLTIGQGEFNSSTYAGFSISSLLNLYDFAQTPELKQLAQAALDWYATNLALRWSWGTVGGAESRGFDRGTWGGSEVAALGWLWWGQDPGMIEQIQIKGLRVAINATLSSYRPPQQLGVIARKQVPLPFEFRASHPAYFTYHRDNQFWETFYVTSDYSLATLLVPQRSYDVKGTINAQYATYKLVVRDPQGKANAVINVGGTYHGPLATGASPGDQTVQKRGTVLYQLRLNDRDRAAGVPAQSRLVLPARYGMPQRYQDWYIWRIEQTWLCVRGWGDEIRSETLAKKQDSYQALVANGAQTAWITDIARVADYPNWQKLTQALDRTRIEDQQLETQGRFGYVSLAGDHLEMQYDETRGVAQAKMNGQPRLLQNWDVINSPYVAEKLRRGSLTISVPKQPQWRLTLTPGSIQRSTVSAQPS